MVCCPRYSFTEHNRDGNAWLLCWVGSGPFVGHTRGTPQNVWSRGLEGQSGGCERRGGGGGVVDWRGGKLERVCA